LSKEAPDRTGTDRFILKKHEIAVLLVSIFMISFAVLSTEISLTRMFSVMFAHHYAFLAVAIAFAGLGFMLIEGSFVQKFILFLGPPTVAISVVLFSLLLSMGIGGFFSRRGKESASLALRACLSVGIILVLYVFTLPLMFNSFKP
jgi:hypothetical protein